MLIIDPKCLIVKYIDPIRLGRYPANRRGQFRLSQHGSFRRDEEKITGIPAVRQHGYILSCRRSAGDGSFGSGNISGFFAVLGIAANRMFPQHHKSLFGAKNMAPVVRPQRKFRPERS